MKRNATSHQMPGEKRMRLRLAARRKNIKGRWAAACFSTAADEAIAPAERTLTRSTKTTNNKKTRSICARIRLSRGRGRTLIIETGELAKQANGSVLVRYGDANVVLAAVTASEQPRSGVDFFPLTCEFEEKMYAAGKIPGGYIKREGRPSEHGTLSARQIDRPIRPLFEEGFRNDVMIVTTVLSIDRELDADVLAVCGAGAALAVSDIPFAKNVAAVRVGRDENGKYIINPTLPQYESGGMDIVIAGTLDGVMMVEGGGHEISEEDLLGAVEFGPRSGQEDRYRDQPAAEKSRQEKTHVSAARR